MLGPSAVKPEASQGMGQSKFYLSFVIHLRPSAAGLSRIQEAVRKIVELGDSKRFVKDRSQGNHT